ncbi:MAG: molybdenum cofactor biosynthesis protein MoaB [Deltaproteobacteria bacterium]|nr:molybdenum cofactor biosynthesis protein MoaB [Deltaproteobacteria bacterium]
MAVEDHKKQAPTSVRCMVVTVSDTRTQQDDRSGNLAATLLTAAGHELVAHRIIPDDRAVLSALVREVALSAEIDCLFLTGGTGLSQRDQTFEAVSSVLTKRMNGFGELFRLLSYEAIGPAAMLSRAVAGVCGKVVVFAVPGSPNAVQLALSRLILPELGHAVREAKR